MTIYGNLQKSENKAFGQFINRSMNDLKVKGVII